MVVEVQYREADKGIISKVLPEAVQEYKQVMANAGISAGMCVCVCVCVCVFFFPSCLFLFSIFQLTSYYEQHFIIRNMNISFFR